MALEQPFPDGEELLATIGAAVQRLGEIDASEGAAGNMSLLVSWPLELGRRFPLSQPIELLHVTPALGGSMVIVTGSGRRLRDVHLDPAAKLAAVNIDADGRRDRLHTSPPSLFQRVIAEFNSNRAVHNDQVRRLRTNVPLIHTQPPRLTCLNHIRAHHDQDYLNQHLIRWEPETIVNVPEGIEVLPYKLPGSPSMIEAKSAGLRAHRPVLWSKHGVIARSDLSETRASDRSAYAETAALYRYMKLINGKQSEGLSQDEPREVLRAFHIPTTLVSAL
ncbi:MAG: rhamnulose-1-phosphate aldolase [Chloroflexota bacterium]